MKAFRCRTIGLATFTLWLALQSTVLADLNTGLVAHYPFDGNANDASGNGNNGATNGTTLCPDRFGNPNAAMNFNGTSSYINMLYPLPDMTNASFGVWLNIANRDGVERVVFFEGDATPGYDFSLRIKSGNLSNFTTKNNLANWLLFFPDSAIPIGSWVHVVGTFNSSAGVKRIYVNGVKIAEAAVTGTANVGYHYRMQAGCIIDSNLGNNPHQFFSGKMDDLRIYNRILSEAEILALFSGTDVGPQPNPPILVQTNRQVSNSEVGDSAASTNTQLKAFTNGSFQMLETNLDSSRMTIVLTHGWNSDPNGWAANMAALIVTNVSVPTPNIVAWDWSQEAATPWLLGGPLTDSRKAPRQGEMLGQALLAALGTNYSQRIHFIGHSLGTLVNAAAADFAHRNGYAWTNTHVTLFDETELAPEIVSGALTELITLKNHRATEVRPFYDRPLPYQAAWADNYISAVGVPHHESANVILTNGFPDDGLIVFHGYPYQWYEFSATNVAGTSALMGYRWSFERSGVAGAPATNSTFIQKYSASPLDLQPTNFDDGVTFLSNRLQSYAVAFGYTVVNTVESNSVVQVAGQVAGQVEEAITRDPYSITGSGFTVGWGLSMNLRTSSGGGSLALNNNGPHPLDAGGIGTNASACAWLPLNVPSNATSMSFDFILQGDGKDDSFVAALNGTNILSLPTSLIETNVTMNSGLIDATPYAGQQVELFLGIVGGSSTNANVTVSSIRFYSVVQPSLQAQALGNKVVLTWPLSALNYILVSSTNLVATNSWTIVTNVPAIVNSQNTVTNYISPGQLLF